MSLAMGKRQNGYRKMKKEDPDEKKHRQAQFLIYKIMEQANSSPRRRPSSCLRIRIRKLKVRIGRRFKKLKKTLLMTFSTAKNGVCKQFGHLKINKSLFQSGKEGTLANFPPLFT